MGVADRRTEAPVVHSLGLGGRAGWRIWSHSPEPAEEASVPRSMRKLRKNLTQEARRADSGLASGGRR